MATASAPPANDAAVKQVRLGFRFQLQQLHGDDTEKQAVARQRIPQIIVSANKIGATLPSPASLGFPVAEEEHADLLAGANFYSPEEADAPAPGPVATKTKGDKNKEANKVRKEKLAEAKAIKEEQKAGKAATKSAKKAAKEPHPCLDGCGREVKGTFAPGHDAKLKSLILRIERGEADMDDLPEVAQPHVTFEKGELIKETKKVDGKDTVVERQTYVCTASPVKLPAR